ncbi:MAG: hypothetical protein J5I98_23460 [Phaeodactylibacter sp.]|nr:hypothetical protein [Phaeodactylibacter sp.]
MIRYHIAYPDLANLIETEKPGWLQRAAERTERFGRTGRYDESSAIWSEVKAVYMRLQGAGKCAFCERKLESETFGKGEQDVEHFRPKGKVKQWPIPPALNQAGIQATKVPSDNKGYFLLAYHPFNYAASCKPCNSSLKGNYFPIKGRYDLTGKDPIDMAVEEPFLIYPIGDFDAAPEDLIRFHGVSPQPVARAGFQRQRALVVIDFFKLDDAIQRKNLIRERALVIVALFPQLQKIANGASGQELNDAQAIVDGFTSEKAPHTNCARSFVRLFQSDHAEASRIFNLVVAFISSSS